ncbi:MAG TPA: hypothetical protein VK796_04640 [Cytophaga sp.]|nr:hypothetical protein [Cytophaga sp.]
MAYWLKKIKAAHFICLFLLQLFFLHVESKACSCSFDKYLTIDEYNESAFIFTGRIIRIDTVMFAMDKYQKAFFVIDTLYKGNYKTDTIIVHTHVSQGMCGIRFGLSNEPRMIFASYKNNFVNGKTTNERFLYTGLCYRNCMSDTTGALATKKIIWENNYKFLRQIQANKNFTFDQYYLSTRSVFQRTPADTLYAKGTIKDGTAVSVWYYYNSDKSLKKETMFTPDGFIKEQTGYYPNGYIDYKIVYDQYGKEESYIDYDETGAIVKQENGDPNSTGVREKVYYKPTGNSIVVRY